MSLNEWKEKYGMLSIEEGGFWTKQELYDLWSNTKNDPNFDPRDHEPPSRGNPAPSSGVVTVTTNPWETGDGPKRTTSNKLDDPDWGTPGRDGSGVTYDGPVVPDNDFDFWITPAADKIHLSDLIIEENPDPRDIEEILGRMSEQDVNNLPDDQKSSIWDLIQSGVVTAPTMIHVILRPEGDDTQLPDDASDVEPTGADVSTDTEPGNEDPDDPVTMAGVGTNNSNNNQITPWWLRTAGEIPWWAPIALGGAGAFLGNALSDDQTDLNRQKEDFRLADVDRQNDNRKVGGILGGGNRRRQTSPLRRRSTGQEVYGEISPGRRGILGTGSKR